jgi:hypothetical protein
LAWIRLGLWCLMPLSKNISVTSISWRSVLLMEESGVPGENHRPAHRVVNPTTIRSPPRRPQKRNNPKAHIQYRSNAWLGVNMNEMLYLPSFDVVNCISSMFDHSNKALDYIALYTKNRFMVHVYDESWNQGYLIPAQLVWILTTYCKIPQLSINISEISIIY